MSHVDNEKWEKRTSGWNSTNKLEKYVNPWREGKSQVHGYMRSGHHQISECEGKIREYFRKKNFWKPNSTTEISAKR